jgi:hypothetical protein
VLRAVEKALLGTKRRHVRPGDPALPNLAARVLGAGAHRAARVEAADGTRFRTLALVGPTGVGKTTTLAKLAARAPRTAANGRDRHARHLPHGRRRAAARVRRPAGGAVRRRVHADRPAPPAAAAQANCDRIFDRHHRPQPARPRGDAAARRQPARRRRATLLCLAAGTRARDCRSCSTPTSRSASTRSA